MPGEKSLEMAAIELAYSTELGALYRVLKGKLNAEALSAQEEKDAINAFTAGLKLNMRTKEVALKAIAAAGPP